MLTKPLSSAPLEPAISLIYVPCDCARNFGSCLVVTEASLAEGTIGEIRENAANAIIAGVCIAIERRGTVGYES